MAWSSQSVFPSLSIHFLCHSRGILCIVTSFKGSALCFRAVAQLMEAFSRAQEADLPEPLQDGAEEGFQRRSQSPQVLTFPFATICEPSGLAVTSCQEEDTTLNACFEGNEDDSEGNIQISNTPNARHQEFGFESAALQTRLLKASE